MTRTTNWVVTDLMNTPRTAERPAPPEASPVEDLVSTHLALVGHLAREAAARMPRHLDTDDLVGAGSLALVQAARTYDPSLGVPFARYASTRIRGAMIDHMRSRDWATRTVRARARALSAVVEDLTRYLHREPTEDELVAATALSRAEIRGIAHATDRAALLSLDPAAADGESIAESLADRAPRPEEVLLAAERLGYLRDAVAELPERARQVITGYYLEARQLNEIAATLGVTQSRASQLRAEGLALLHQALSTLLDDDLPPPSGPARRPGARGRRRDDYVHAVATRSSARARADVRGYRDPAGRDSLFPDPCSGAWNPATGSPSQAC